MKHGITEAIHGRGHKKCRTTLNTRELGGYRTKNGGYTKCERLIRSDMQKYPGHQNFPDIDMNIVILREEYMLCSFA